MATVDVDIIEESGLKLTRKGWEKTRVYMVKGLTGDASAREYEAMQHVPSIGAFHESIPFVRVDDVFARAESTDLVRVRVTYRTPQFGGSQPPQLGDPARIEVWGSLESTTTNLDKDGNLIEVPVPEGYEPKEGETPEPLHPMVNLMLPVFGIRLIKRVSFAPDSLATQYVGTVNATTFLGRPAKTWLCTAIHGDSDDGGQTFVHRYEFAHRPQTWSARLVWQASDGTIPANQTPVAVDLYEEKDFNNIGI